MAYKKVTKRNFNKTGRKISRIVKGAKSAWSLGKMAVKGVQFLKNIINSEKKSFSTSQSVQNVNYNGTIFPLSQISQGDAIDERVGNSILSKALLIKYAWRGNFASEQYNHVRFMVFMDTMNTGTIPTVADVLNSIGSSNAPNSHLTRINAMQFRFKILHDEAYILCQYGESAKTKSVYIKLDQHLKYTGTSGTDEGKNQIYVLVIGDNNTNLPNISYISKLKYYDN